MLPLLLWLGRGQPLSPYIVGYLVHFLRRKLSPRDLRPPPSSLFEQPGMGDFLEWSLLRSWMEEWLLLLKWYYCTALDDWVTLETLLEEAPVVTSGWNCNRKKILLGLVLSGSVYN